MTTAVAMPAEKWTGAVRDVQIGAGLDDGGTRWSIVHVGGQSGMPFLSFDGTMPNRPKLALEVCDVVPNWPLPLLEAWGRVVESPTIWAQRAASYGIDLVALSLVGTHPENGDRGPDHAVAVVRRVLESVGMPLIIYGPGLPEKDNVVLEAVAEATAGERLAFGVCEQDNYRTIAAACLAHGHVAVAKAPIDVNIQKQLNILITDLGLPADRILMDPTTGALGYGLEYTYSVIERLRLAALQGDSMTQMPIICNLGEDVWRAKETFTEADSSSSWGYVGTRSVAWEVSTAMALLHAGADVLVMRHPRALMLVRQAIDKLTRASARQEVK